MQFLISSQALSGEKRKIGHLRPISKCDNQFRCEISSSIFGPCFHLFYSRLFVLPRLAIKSRVALKESLSKSNLKSVFSETADLSLVSKQQGLRLGELLQVVSFNLEAGTEIQKKEQKEAEELIFNRPFTFLVRQTPSNSTIVIGHIWGQNEK